MREHNAAADHTAIVVYDPGPAPLAGPIVKRPNATPRSAGRMLTDALDDLRHLHRAYLELRESGGPQTLPDTPVDAKRLFRVLVWSEALERVRSRGLQPLRPDGSALEASVLSTLVRIETRSEPGAGWTVRPAAPGPRAPGLRRRYPWLRVV